ncbi:MAG: phosphoribosylamine--glycine ligase [Thermoleophilia bacterium]|nr:phosphoribosylamine--glycine ligase [Thermoleophilia bacterium]
MKVLVVGSGGREHALARALVRSPALTELHAAPGNPGIARLGRCHPVRGEDVEGLVDLCRSARIDLAVVGPEAPLVAGAADALRRSGVAVFGPSALAARIEGSKTYAKDVMEAAGVATARRLGEATAPCVIKADGLAGGKGVFVCPTPADVAAALPRARALGGTLLVEELLEGVERSVFAVCDGERAIPLPAAQDYKRLADGDRGPNTGGMGAFSPVPGLAGPELEAVLESVHRPVLAELARRGTPFVGLLYAGLMLTERGPLVLEFNCRFGDPETQAILPRLDSDPLGLLAAAAGGDLSGQTPAVSSRAAVTVVLASRGYPESSETGVAIGGLDQAERAGAIVLHAGTALRGATVVSAGGRVLNVTAVGETVAQARARAYEAIEHIDFPGAQYRRDIALEATDVRA